MMTYCTAVAAVSLGGGLSFVGKAHGQNPTNEMGKIGDYLSLDFLLIWINVRNVDTIYDKPVIRVLLLFFRSNQSVATLPLSVVFSLFYKYSPLTVNPRPSTRSDA
jgi:hypothetical protein